METIPLRFQYAHGVWLAEIQTPFGQMQVMVGGTKDAPDEADLAALEQFLPDAGMRIRTLRKKLRWGFMYRPIRLAMNMEHRVGVQFRHRLTGYQGNLLLD